MNKLIAIIGAPGTGKTTLMREWMKKRKWKEHKPCELMYGHLSEDERIFVIGKYEEGEQFAGTDRLSMAVQPKAIEYMKDPYEITIFEGDRLSSTTFLQEAELLGAELHIIALDVPMETLEQRYEERGSNQSKTFVMGRISKVENIARWFGGSNLFDEDSEKLVRFEHATTTDMNVIIDHIEGVIAK